MLRTVTTALELYLSDSIGLLVQEENQKRPRWSPQKGANLDKFFLSYDKRGVGKRNPHKIWQTFHATGWSTE